MSGGEPAVRGLILDFGGVLTTSMRQNALAFERSEGLPPGAYLRALAVDPDCIDVYAALEVGRATQQDWNEVVGRTLGLDPTNLMRRALANLRLDPAMVDVVRRARARGVKTAILSNSFGLEPFDPYRELGVEAEFDALVLSEVEHVRKPSPEIYVHALATLGLAGEVCLFVDDTAVNLPPAAAVGMRVLHHVDPAATCRTLNRLLDGLASMEDADPPGATAHSRSMASGRRQVLPTVVNTAQSTDS
ncbi:hypothetical protein BIV57_18145 [Mangrovactinospora gilvigrisea]|uniref:Haloacid dehalogenase n=1 Tax=Mangrovactinospora gilvigrisea TaxID=1428644 RepID=A0A1J7BRL1_9ACTN|nr:HAD family phosphatase [Mangrovactinospora gilvigrisea]OIV36081.1 hypothetical protein BIV57_18145 [Mangrovactinospora gilvigrisea]